MLTGQQSNISTFAKRSGKLVTSSINNGILKKQDYLTMRNSFYFIKNGVLFWNFFEVVFLTVNIISVPKDGSLIHTLYRLF